MPAIVGYTSRLSVPPGEELDVMVSCTDAEFAAELVRIHGPETDFGSAPWFRAVPVGDSPRRLPGRVQRTTPGSYARVPHLPLDRDAQGVTLHCWVAPTLPGNGRSQALICLRANENRAGIRLFLDPAGRPAMRMWVGEHEDVVTLDEPLAAGKW